LTRIARKAAAAPRVLLDRAREARDRARVDARYGGVRVA